jgi:Ca-activated chloride channel homolog
MRNLGLCALTTFAVIVAVCGPSAAASFNKRLDRAHALLKTGDVKGALTEYRDLQTEEPESPVLYYNIGRAQYQSGMQSIDLKANQDALESFNQAKASFEKVLNTADPEIRKEAAFNHANSVAQVAMQSAAAQKYQETVDAFKQSVAEYETFLRQFPDHEGARKNLDHMRYLLKTMMQNPPKEQDQQQQKGQDEKSQDQKKDDKQQGQDQDKKDEQKSEEQKQDEQKKEEQKKEEEKQQAEQKQGEQQGAKEAEKKEDQKDQQQQADDQKPDDKQNTDAILQSLEDIDKREQKESRNEHGNVKIRSNWW